VAPISGFLNVAYYRPVIPVTLSLIAGIILAEGMPGFAVPAWFIVIVTTGWLVICLRREHPARWSPLLASVAAGYLAMLPWMSPNFGSDHIVHYLNSGYWQIHGRVVDQPIAQLGRTRLILDVSMLSRADETQSVRGRIRLTVMGEVNLAPGDRVTFPASIRPLRNFKNPGGFDFRRHMAFKGVHASAWVHAEKLQIRSSLARTPNPRCPSTARSDDRYRRQPRGSGRKGGAQSNSHWRSVGYRRAAA
jgi:competence protein ComEC